MTTKCDKKKGKVKGIVFNVHARTAKTVLFWMADIIKSGSSPLVIIQYHFDQNCRTLQKQW